MSLISYWTGEVNQDVKEAAQLWIPQELDVIPLQILDSEDVLLLNWVTGEIDAA